MCWIFGVNCPFKRFLLDQAGLNFSFLYVNNLKENIKIQFFVCFRDEMSCTIKHYQYRTPHLTVNVDIVLHCVPSSDFLLVVQSFRH